MILVDTSGLILLYDRADRRRMAALTVVKATGPRILSPFVLAEADYLLGRRFGRRAQMDLLEEAGRGVYQLEAFDIADVEIARRVRDRYSDHDIGLTDASMVVLARRFDCLDVLTLDERHFRVLRGPGDRPFRILPADAAG